MDRIWWDKPACEGEGDTTTRPLSSIFKKLWWSGVAHVSWKKGNVTHNFKKSKEKIQTGQPHLNPMEQIILEAASSYIRDMKVTERWIDKWENHA